MKIQKLKGLAYDGASGIVGVIAGIDYIKETVEVIVEDGTKEVVSIDEVVFLEEIGEFDGEAIYNHDVFTYKEEVKESVDDKFWELTLEDNGMLVFHLLEIVENKFKRKESGAPVGKSELATFEAILEVVGNLYEIEIEQEKTVDFNIVITKRTTATGLEYLYACNNKEKEEVDLIKVVFVGAKLLEEEYSRETITHEEYLTLVEYENLKEVSPQELQNYVTGLMYGESNDAVEDEDEDYVEDEEFLEDDDDEDEEDICRDCGEYDIFCEC